MHDALLAAVLAAPGQDEPRAVYSDYLQERGDPRGEFIALQLQRHRAPGSVTDAQRAREHELLAQHQLTWLGPLAEVVEGIEGVQFERGFLAACHSAIRCRAHRAVVGHPGWGTVRRLTSAHLPLLTHPALGALETVAGFGTDVLLALCEQPRELPITHIELDHLNSPVAEADALCRTQAPALKRLRCLSVLLPQDAPSDPSSLSWLLECAIGRRLTALELCAHPQPATCRDLWLAAWMDRFERQTSLSELLLDGDSHFRYGLVRTQSQAPALLIEHRGGAIHSSDRDAIAATLSSLDPSRVSRVELALASGFRRGRLRGFAALGKILRQRGFSVVLPAHGGPLRRNLSALAITDWSRRASRAARQATFEQWLLQDEQPVPPRDSWEVWREDRCCYAYVRPGEVVVGSHAGSGHTDNAGSCTLEQFLAGTYQDVVRTDLGDSALREMIVAAEFHRSARRR